MSTAGLLLLAAAALLLYEGYRLIAGSGKATDAAASAAGPPAVGGAAGAGGAIAPGQNAGSSVPGGGGAAVRPGQWEQQVADWARAHGIDPLIAVATVYGESGGYGNNPNLSDPYGGSYGIFQINGVHIAGMPHSPGDWGVPMSQVNNVGYILNQTPEGSNWISAFQRVAGSISPSGNPGGFLSAFWPIAQGSVQPSQQQVSDAIAQARAAQQAGYWR